MNYQVLAFRLNAGVDCALLRDADGNVALWGWGEDAPWSDTGQYDPTLTPDVFCQALELTVVPDQAPGSVSEPSAAALEREVFGQWPPYDPSTVFTYERFSAVNDAEAARLGEQDPEGRDDGR